MDFFVGIDETRIFRICSDNAKVSLFERVLPSVISICK